MFRLLISIVGFLLSCYPVAAEDIYFAAEKLPANNASSEAPLCYKFHVSNLEEQLGKLKVKYGDTLYDEKIVKNDDGSRSLLARRKDESGKEVQYFYSNSPIVCSKYQQTRLGAGGIPAQVSRNCDAQLVEKLRTALHNNTVSCYEAVEVRLADSAIGWLFITGYPRRTAVLVWLAGHTVQMPLSTAEEEKPWDFLNIDSIGDFDRDGSVEALIIGTGGAGMYNHYPIILRLGSDGNWKILFTPDPDKPFFYGSTELLPPSPDGRIQLAITSVDEDAAWAFFNCSLCSHPFKRETFSLVNGRLQLRNRSPKASSLSVLSDLILAARTHSFDTIRHYFPINATVGGEEIKSPDSLEGALGKLRLPETESENCHEREEEEGTEQISSTTVQGKTVAIIGSGRAAEDVVRFECVIGEDLSLRYVATVVKEGDRYVILSLNLEGTFKVE